ncbi:Uncharacterised protein [uncultured archaeon]|nr:Uncharacterised protein [uncultured archaeon]
MDLLIKIIKSAGAAYKEFTKDENYTKGVDFEKYVVSLFSKEHFKINDWTRDNSKNLDQRVESDSNPDLTIRYLNTNELFSIECKFRSYALNNNITWARPDQIMNYQRYEHENKIPTFLVIGLGGIPDDPKRMFCLPISKARYTNLFMSYLENYERPPYRMFFWKNRTLI